MSLLNWQSSKQFSIPLADKLRPSTFETIFGQDHLLNKDVTIHRMLKSSNIQSIILWGPPGVGKTTIARTLASQSGSNFEIVSAVTSGFLSRCKVLEVHRLSDEALKNITQEQNKSLISSYL